MKTAICIIVLAAMMFFGCEWIKPELDLTEVPGALYFRSENALVKWTPSTNEIDTVFASDSLKIADLSPDGKSLLIYRTIEDSTAKSPYQTFVNWYNLITCDSKTLVEGDYRDASMSYFSQDGEWALVRVVNAKADENGSIRSSQFVVDSSGSILDIGTSMRVNLSPDGKKFLMEIKDGESASINVISTDLNDTTVIASNTINSGYRDMRTDWFDDSTVLVDYKKESPNTYGDNALEEIERYFNKPDSLILCSSKGEFIKDLSSITKKIFFVGFFHYRFGFISRRVVPIINYKRSRLGRIETIQIYDRDSLLWEVNIPVYFKPDRNYRPMAISSDRECLLLVYTKYKTQGKKSVITDSRIILVNSRNEIYRRKVPLSWWFLRWID